MTGSVKFVSAGKADILVFSSLHSSVFHECPHLDHGSSCERQNKKTTLFYKCECKEDLPANENVYKTFVLQCNFDFTTSGGGGIYE